MTKQRGREMVLSIDTGSSNYKALGTLNSKALTINNAPVDVTTPPDDPSDTLWMETLDGVKSVTISGDGLFADAAGEETLREAGASTGATRTFRMLIPSFGIFEGTFRIESLEYSGDTGEGVGFSISLSSAGDVTYTAAVAPAWTATGGAAISWTRNTAITAVTVPAVDTGNGPIYYRASGLPAGITFDRDTRKLAGRPTTAGTGTITITARNTVGSDTYTYAWTVS